MDYDYDMFDNELSLENDLYYDDDQPASMPYDQVYTLCVKPTFFQTINAVIYVLIWNVIFRICIQVIKLPPFLQNLSSIVTALFVLYSMFPSTFYIILILPFVSYPILLALAAHRGTVLLVLSSLVLISYELIWLNPKIWHQIRGCQMIIVMKVISLGFDVDIGTVKSVPGVLEFWGYILFPGNCVFGPWISFNDHLTIFKQTKWKWNFLKDFLLKIVYAFLSLSISSCWTSFFITDNQWKWIVAYRDALSFRASHYFISFLSEATMILSGYSNFLNNADSSVARPFDIELPRSLIQVVVSWNVPMHNWLKIYVFNTTRAFGGFLAILSTYAVSALLHGLNFQLGAVLLSLGFYSYIEFMLRKKLALIFSACIQARPCKTDCTHVNKRLNTYVIGTNVFLGILTMIHLAYLGLMFDHDPKSETGYSYSHTLGKWAHLDYLSHYLALLCYGIYYLI